MSVSGVDNNVFNAYFGNNNNTGSNSIFGTGVSSSSALGDYALIKSGSYKKLLKAYYAKTSSDKSAEENTDSTADMLTAKGHASDLKSAASALVGNSALFETVKDEDGKDVLDEDGKKTYDRKAIKEKVKAFVDSYNETLQSAGDLDSTSVLSATLRMVKGTAAYKNLLSSVGITIGEENKLQIDEEKLDSADINDLKTVFSGRNSFADQVSTRASQIYNITSNQAYTNTRAATYTFNGTTSMLGTTNGYVNDLI